MIGKIYSFDSIPQAIASVKEEYESDITYLEGKFDHNGHYFKIRMNKDHAMKGWNNGSSEHVLSIVNGPCDSFRSIGDVIWIEKRIYDNWQWFHIEEIVLDFLTLVYNLKPVENEA